jgi:hypothetical protein
VRMPHRHGQRRMPEDPLQHHCADEPHDSKTRPRPGHPAAADPSQPQPRPAPRAPCSAAEPHKPAPRPWSAEPCETASHPAPRVWRSTSQPDVVLEMDIRCQQRGRHPTNQSSVPASASHARRKLRMPRDMKNSTRFSHAQRRPVVMGNNAASNPAQISLLRPNAVVLQPDTVADLVE